MAISADAKRFVGQPCCVQAMRNIWYGMIDRDKNSWKRLFVGIFTFGLSAVFTIRFRKTMLIYNSQASIVL